MKGSRAALLCVLCCFAAMPQDDSSSQRTVAVSAFEVEARGADLNWIGESFADAVIARLAASPTLRVVERSFLSQIAKEIALHMTGLVEESTAVEAGHVLGAAVMVAGRVTVAGDMAEAHSRIVRVETGEVLGTVQASGPLGQIVGVMRETADGICTKLSVHSLASSAAPAARAAVSGGVQRKLDRCARMAEGLPLVGQDPARKRKLADYDNGISLAEEMIGEQPGLAAGHYYKALFSLNSDDLSVAREECATAKELDPGDLRPLLLEANLAFCAKDMDKAEAAFRQATTVCPYDSRGWYGLGRAQIKKQRKKEAVVAFVEAIRHMPVIPEALTNLQTLLAGPAASALCEELRQTHGRYYAPAVVFSAFFTTPRQYRQNIVTRAAADFPDLFIAHYAQGVLAAGSGDVAKAQAHLGRCVALYPSFPDAHRELGILCLGQKKCALGRNHIAVYTATASQVADYGELDAMIRKCAR